MDTIRFEQLTETFDLPTFHNLSTFGALSEDFIERCLRKATIEKLAPGEHLFSTGERPDAFFIILAGSVSFYRTHANGDTFIRTHTPGENIGFASMISLQTRIGNALADSDCIALKISCEAFSELQESDPQQFAIFMLNLSRDMGRFLIELVDAAGAITTSSAA